MLSAHFRQSESESIKGCLFCYPARNPQCDAIKKSNKANIVMMAVLVVFTNYSIAFLIRPVCRKTFSSSGHRKSYGVVWFINCFSKSS